MQEGALWPVLREYWHPVAFADDLNDGPVSVQLLDERVAVCRLGGDVKAFYDLCIHRGTPLSLGWVEGDRIVCAYHGWSYAGDGRCTRIPSVPDEHPIPKKACLTPYRAAERYGLVWVCMADEPRPPSLISRNTTILTTHLLSAEEALGLHRRPVHREFRRLRALPLGA